jgi:esterase/lipase superfamily enzyme
MGRMTLLPAWRSDGQVHDEQRQVTRRTRGALVLLLFLLGSTGCAKPPQLMPTPNLYTSGELDPFPDVPPVLRNNKVDVLYITDRAMEPGGSAQAPKYGYGRSRAVAFGTSQVQFGKDVSWDQLVRASRSRERSVDLPVSVAATTELGRFPPTPRTLILLPGQTDAQRDEAEHAAERAFCDQLSAQLALTPAKEVYLFVHGYNNDFTGSVQTIAQLWHFFGRHGVPVAYTWPAGRGGLLRGYTYDRESGEFTVFHLKKMLKQIAACPDVAKVHILAHSRGTDVLVTALRELHLELGGGGGNKDDDGPDDPAAGDGSRGGAPRTREVLKLGTVVLAAPDMDTDVVIQRMITVRLGQVPERSALYVCRSDKALGMSNWLFRGSGRFGTLSSSIFSPAELEALRSNKTVQIIDARVSNPGPYGHSYFHSNPAVSSDLILLMRYQLPPGSQNGRPLRVDQKGFWVIDDHYPEEVKPVSTANVERSVP